MSMRDRSSGSPGGQPPTRRSRPCPTATLGAADVAVVFFDGEAGFFETLVDLGGDEHGAVMAAGAAE